jgi:ribosome-associated protein
MATSASKRRNPRSASLVELEEQVLAALTDMKAVNIKLLDVRGLTDVADTMIIASGTSDRHVRAIADNVVTRAKELGYRPRGVEGTRDSEWVLVDLQDVLVHVMLPRVREFYALEQLWEAPAEQRKASTKAKTASASERQRTTRPAAKRPRASRRSARR